MSNNNKAIINIAIDGPAGSGKSTAAKNLASALGIEYIDTGAMYRAVAYKALNLRIKLDDEASIKSMLDNTKIDFVKGNIFLDDENVSGDIRKIEIAQAASKVSKLAVCRNRLADLQRSIASDKSIVMDGRDIGTNVLPNADYKFFITASAEKRANRRYQELKDKDGKISYESVLKDIIGRDLEDTNRKLNPLKKAEDAIEVNTDEMDIEQTTNRLLSYIKN